MTDRPTERAEFTENLEQRIESLVQEFQEMELEQMRRGEMQARAKLADVKKIVDGKRESARKSLAFAHKASAAAWGDAKEGLQSAWRELRDAVQTARDEFAEEAQGVA
jgi:hypothetical protein